jgi:hypothetical protein
MGRGGEATAVCAVAEEEEEGGEGALQARGGGKGVRRMGRGGREGYEEGGWGEAPAAGCGGKEVGGEKAFCAGKAPFPPR